MKKFRRGIDNARQFRAALEKHDALQWGDHLYVLRLRDWSGAVRAWLEGYDVGALPFALRSPTMRSAQILKAADREAAIDGRVLLVLCSERPYAWVVPIAGYWAERIQRELVQDDAWLAELGEDYDPDVGTMREIAREFGVDYRNCYGLEHLGLWRRASDNTWMVRRSVFRRWRESLGEMMEAPDA